MVAESAQDPTLSAKEKLDYVKDYVRSLVRGGYYTRDEIIEDAKYAASEEGLASVDSGDLVDDEINQQLREQEIWPEVTDYDRLVRALVALEMKGIVARQNFACCQTCGHAEIEDEIESFAATGGDPRGYVFFHQQGTESAIRDGEVGFAYGPAKEDVDSADIASELANEMRAVGLKVDWNGESSMCVMVSLDWKRRWPGEDPIRHAS
jgi:hypothetical protein